MSMNTGSIEYREGDDFRNTPRKYPGLTKFGNVTLRWGVTDERDFIQWMYTAAPKNNENPTGRDCREVTISLYTDKGEIGPQWILHNAWPVGYTVPNLSALEDGMAIQSLELCIEGLEFRPEGVNESSSQPNPPQT
jgi:phage tail-like protein